jgi:hypothetical protein
MLCRRCGMESSTTNTCEWCNRPMLPPGATVSEQAAKELKASGRPLITGPANDAEGDVGLPQIGENGTEEVEEEAPEGAGGEGAGEAVHLRPLGGAEDHGAAAVSQPKPEAPAPQPLKPGEHGLSAEVTQTSIDISKYLGSDQSIFRPIVKEEDTAMEGRDLLAQRRKAMADENRGPEMSENQRLSRCLVVGLIVGVVFALAQFLITGKTVQVVYSSIPLGRGDTLITAIKYGIFSGVVYGFGLGALLVRLRKGPGLGFFAGMLVGLTSGAGHWGAIPGAIVGIMAGKIATKGLRRVINV